MQLIKGFYTVVSSKENIDLIVETNKDLDRKENNKFLSLFLPTPDELLQAKPQDNIRMGIKFGVSDWYEWRMKNWGCKHDFDMENIKRINDEKICFYADTPWHMPIEGIMTLEKMGFEFTAIGYNRELNLYYNHTYNNTNVYEKPLEDISTKLIHELSLHFGEQDFVLEKSKVDNKNLMSFSSDSKDVSLKPMEFEMTINNKPASVSIKEALDRKNNKVKRKM